MSAKRYISMRERLEWLMLVMHAGLTVTANKVAACLADHCNDPTGKCNPGRKRLAAMTGLAPTHVSNGLSELRSAGFIMEGISDTRSKQWDLVNLQERYLVRYPRGTRLGTLEVPDQVPITSKKNSVIESPLKPPRENGSIPGSETDHPRASLAPLQGGVVESSPKKSGRRRRDRSKLQMSDERLEHLSGLRARMMDDDG